MIRSGKIARLPEAIREQVNRRLANHESSTPLLAWLNALPEVQEVMTREFGARPIDKHNVSEWRRGGFSEWQRQEEARKLMGQLTADGNDLSKMDAGAVLGTMTTFAAARYVVAMKKLEGAQENGGERSSFKRLRQFLGDITTLRRGEQMADRLEFERERLAWWREKRNLKAPGTDENPGAQPQNDGKEDFTIPEHLRPLLYGR